MSATIIAVNTIGTAIQIINPSVEAERIAADYAFYKAHPDYIARQAQHDADCAALPEITVRIDLAWAKAQDRARIRAMPKTGDMLAKFRADVVARHYAQATGTAAF